MALPAQNSSLPLASQEGDYGNCRAGLGADSLSMRAPIRTSPLHPLEEAERTYRDRQAQLSSTLDTRAFGLGFAMHMRHQKAAAGYPGIGHVSGVLPRSNAMLDALTAMDLDFDFTDTLALELRSTLSPHEIMERKLTGGFK